MEGQGGGQANDHIGGSRAMRTDLGCNVEVAAEKIENQDQEGGRADEAHVF